MPIKTETGRLLTPLPEIPMFASAFGAFSETRIHVGR